MNYQKLFNIYQNYNEYDREKLKYDELSKDYGDAIVSAYKLLTGKKKKFPNALKGLDPETVAKIMTPFQKVMTERVEKRKKIKANMGRILKDFAKTYTPKHSEERFCVHQSSASDYHSQGCGASKYAKAHLGEDELLLTLHGFDTEIRENGYTYVTSWNKETIHVTDYELWANITPFDFWMLKNSGIFISVLNWAVLCWRKGVNPKVYFPFLSDIDYEKSQSLSRDSKYVITKDNCMLEPSIEGIDK